MPDRTIFAYIGTYTPNGIGGIHTYRLDPASGRLTLAQPVTPVQDPSYLAVSQDRRFLYSVIETEQFASRTGGAVAAYAINWQNGALTELNRQPTMGRLPCHIAVDSGSTAVFAANYKEGTATVFPLNADGRIAPASCTLRHQGSAPIVERQEGPHVHCMALTPDERFLCVVDLGVDSVVFYHFDSESGDVSPADIEPIAMKPGSGPRHMAFHPNGRFAYVITELSNEIAVFKYCPSKDTFTHLQTISTLPEGFTDASYCAAVHFSPDGRTLYGSNRGHDSIAAFSVDGQTGLLTPIGHTPTGGSFPRDFAVSPDGRFLYAANEKSDTVVAFSIDGQTGALRPTGQIINIPKPTCVKFVEVG